MGNKVLRTHLLQLRQSSLEKRSNLLSGLSNGDWFYIDITIQFLAEIFLAKVVDLYHTSLLAFSLSTRLMV